MQTHSDDLHYSRTSVYSLQYHLIIVTKYRRDVLTGSVKQELEALLRSLADQFDMQIEEMEIMSDHVHMLVDASPKHSISSIMKGLKGVSARMLFMHHPEIKQKLWGGHLWQPSYFAVTVSERSEEQIRHYIQHQKPSKGKTR
ncbi:IS200/IS605 family transposase [Limosilactobacillus mucosae]|uniref:IS200/IS605 family transposase n=1 Tax=Limosilactobacillus mucosae TaxID=97478 RepID=UPI001F59E0C3|nr:IS200/IS605 family transposase [Limosilactobacillus mucosae]UNL62512.1 IS200/IS605 family transposase [Limosilactobacillus mucosae]